MASVTCFVIKHYVLYTATTFFVNKEKLNNISTITSLKLYILKLSCISISGEIQRLFSTFSLSIFTAKKLMVVLTSRCGYLSCNIPLMMTTRCVYPLRNYLCIFQDTIRFLVIVPCFTWEYMTPTEL